MKDKEYCMSSYLALKYIEDNKKNFIDGLTHQNYIAVSDKEKILVNSAQEIDKEIKKQFAKYKNKKIGIFLSGGMDSAIVASYFRGADAYTFRYVGIDYPQDEIRRAEQFSNYYGLNLHYVDITWETLIEHLDELMINKASPIYYIEPQLHQAALQAKSDGMEIIMVGEGSDLVFGGLSWLLAKDWSIDEFIKLYISINPEKVLENPKSMYNVFERYRISGNKIDYLKFLDEIFLTEAYTAYSNAFEVANMPFFDPFERLKMASPLDINRVRNGEPKYLIRELFKIRYPDLPIPDKIRLPNPLDTYMKKWSGPTREEFLKDIDLSKLSGKHKWQLYCLERFLNLSDSD